MYFQDAATGQFEAVDQTGGMLAYYLLNGDNIQPFPTDFRMISGDNLRRTYTAGNPSQPDPPKSDWATTGQTTQSILAQRAIGFNCLNYAKPPEGTLYRHYLPEKAYLDANCKDGIRIELMFPSCWDGKNVDSTNHKDHVAFPDLVMTGNCPSSHPVRLPSLMYEIIWNTPKFAGRNGRFVMANGDTTGFGYHGDFMMGWDEKFLGQAVKTCTNLSGRIEDCPLFKVVDHNTATSCKRQKALPLMLKSEDVTGPMANLPGNVKITFADGHSEGSNEPKSSSVAKPSLTYAPGEKATNKASLLPGQVFKETANAVAAAAAQTTPAPAPPPANAAAPSFFSTQYITNGKVVSEILWKEEVVTVTKMVDAAPTGAAHAKRHQHGRHNF